MPADFTSTTVANLSVWLDNTQGLSTSGGNLTTWTDRVAGLVFSPDTGSAALPVTASHPTTGLPSIAFSGSSWLSAVGVPVAVSTTTHRTVYVVGTFERLSLPDENVLVANSPAGTWTSNLAPGYVFSAYLSTPGKARVQWRNNAGSSGAQFITSSASVFPNSTTPQVFWAWNWFSGSAWFQYAGRGGAPYVGDGASAASLTASGTNGLTIGGAKNGSNTAYKTHLGSIFEVLFFTEGLTQSEHATVMSYLSRKHSLGYPYLTASDPTGQATSTGTLRMTMAVPAQLVAGQGVLTGTATSSVVLTGAALAGQGIATAGPLVVPVELGLAPADGLGTVAGGPVDLVLPLGLVVLGQGALTGSANAVLEMGPRAVLGQGTLAGSVVPTVMLTGADDVGQGRAVGTIERVGGPIDLHGNVVTGAVAHAALTAHRRYALIANAPCPALALGHVRARRGLTAHVAGSVAVKATLRTTHVLGLHAQSAGASFAGAHAGKVARVSGRTGGQAGAVARSGTQVLRLSGKSRSVVAPHLISLANWHSLRARSEGQGRLSALGFHRQTDTSRFPRGLTMARFTTGSLTRPLSTSWPEFDATLESERGPLDLRHAESVVFRWYDPVRGRIEQRPCEMLEPRSSGRVRYLFTRVDFRHDGRFNAHFLVTFGAGVRVHVPNGQSVILCVRGERVTQAGT